ncbi:MAG: GspH/FimT family pseudopilin [Gammaproteobacteria bacterium]|nr:GspH/FimT family pseudopilin [Gammaproteobacteria bacterium]MDH4316132.1 GspH/FimT family pseudopilin [Gammaproteobacteria bacterium]MDH5214945.1 GspH/FimT family pseudopilin [Gammaproteobacteria bacterium]MDH5501941.1 GspH/FimT family pseudopilin [Gammaproteobacteria bacterium]
MKTRYQNGFTLYELLITVLVIGVVVTLGIPNLSAYTQNSRMTSTANDLHSSFLLSRSEAARAKSNITICASANSMAGAAASCGGNFNQGWIIFVDTDGDIVRDAGEAILRPHAAVPNGVNIIPDNGATYFSYAATGLGRGDVNGPSFVTAMICDDRGNVIAPGGASAARRIVVTPIGRSTVIRDKQAIDNAGGVCP